MPTNKTPFRAGSAGFSLVELLLVLSLAPVIFFAVFSNFSAGVRLWQRLQVGTPEEDQVISRIKVQRDIQGALRYASVPFEGEKDEVSFMAGIEAEPELGGKRAIGLIRYYYDESARALFREIRDFSQVYRDSAGEISRAAQNVSNFEFSYLAMDPLADDYVWKDNFHPDKPGVLPLAVRMTFSTQNSSEATQQTIFIPAGGSPV